MARSETAREERGFSMLDELLREASVVRAFTAIEAHHEDLVQPVSYTHLTLPTICSV